MKHISFTSRGAGHETVTYNVDAELQAMANSYLAQAGRKSLSSAERSEASVLVGQKFQKLNPGLSSSYGSDPFDHFIAYTAIRMGLPDEVWKAPDDSERFEWLKEAATISVEKEGPRTFRQLSFTSRGAGHETVTYNVDAELQVMANSYLAQAGKKPLSSSELSRVSILVGQKFQKLNPGLSSSYGSDPFDHFIAYTAIRMGLPDEVWQETSDPERFKWLKEAATISVENEGPSTFMRRSGLQDQIDRLSQLAREHHLLCGRVS